MTDFRLRHELHRQPEDTAESVEQALKKISWDKLKSSLGKNPGPDLRLYCKELAGSILQNLSKESQGDGVEKVAALLENEILYRVNEQGIFNPLKRVFAHQKPEKITAQLLLKHSPELARLMEKGFFRDENSKPVFDFIANKMGLNIETDFGDEETIQPASIKQLQAILEKHNPETWSANYASKISQNLGETLRKTFRTSTDEVDWGTILKFLDPKWQKRFVTRDEKLKLRIKLAHALDNSEDIENMIGSLQKKQFDRLDPDEQRAQLRVKLKKIYNNSKDIENMIDALLKKRKKPNS